jgi:hypothetical protein
VRRLERHGYLVLHDRAIPGARANVDHLVVGPSGAYVVDSKNWGRDRRITRRGRFVHVGKTWGDNVTRAVVFDARAVAAALSAAHSPAGEVVPLLAVHGPYVPLRGMKVNGVRMLRASVVAGWIARRPRSARRHVACGSRRAAGVARCHGRAMSMAGLRAEGPKVPRRRDLGPGEGESYSTAVAAPETVCLR